MAKGYKSKEKTSLESLMGDFDDSELVSTIVQQKQTINKEPRSQTEHSAIGYMDFMKLKDICNDDAEDMLNYMVEFYLSGEILNNSYIKKRMDDDKSTIADMLFNMRSTEHSIMKLLETIDNGGSYNYKNFETLSMLQTAKMGIVKHYEAVKTNLENNYKAMKVDYINQFALDDDIGAIEGYGHRALLKNLAENVDLGLDNVTREQVTKKNTVTDDNSISEGYSLPKGVILYDANRIREQQAEDESED